MSKAIKGSAVNFEYIDFNKLVFLDNNPRTRTDEGKAKMAADIQADPTFYENRPTLVNLKDGVFQVYAGDLRAHAAHDVLGWVKVPCNVQTDVDEVTMRRRAILDNTHRETWDNEKLSEWGYDDDELKDMGVEWKADEDGMMIEPTGDDLIGENKDKPPTMKITFPTAEDLQKCETGIQEIINRICPNAFYSVSAGEI